MWTLPARSRTDRGSNTVVRPPFDNYCRIENVSGYTARSAASDSAAPGPPARAGPRRRRAPLDGRGVFPSRQRTGRARRAPGPTLDLLAALDPARDARAPPARRHRRPRAPPPPRACRAHRLDLQRDPPLFTIFVIEP